MASERDAATLEYGALSSGLWGLGAKVQSSGIRGRGLLLSRCKHSPGQNGARLMDYCSSQELREWPGFCSVLVLDKSLASGHSINNLGYSASHEV